MFNSRTQGNERNKTESRLKNARTQRAHRKRIFMQTFF